MLIRTHLPTMVNGHIQSNAVLAMSDATAQRLIKAGVAEPDDYLDEMKRRAAALGQDPYWKYPERKQGQTSVIAAVGTTESESFAAKLAKTTKSLAARATRTVKQHKEQAERERNRYKPFSTPTAQSQASDAAHSRALARIIAARGA